MDRKMKWMDWLLNVNRLAMAFRSVRLAKSKSPQG